MSGVLDTRSVIWYSHSPGSLSAHALQAIRSAVAKSRLIFVSVISLVETIYLVERGRLPVEALRRFQNALKSPKFGVLIQPPDEAVAEMVYRVPRAAVPDMPDRVIAATALYLGLLVVTRGQAITRYWNCIGLVKT